MNPQKSERVVAAVLAGLLTLCWAQTARAQAGAGTGASARNGRARPKEEDERARAFLEEGLRRADEGKWDEAIKNYDQALAVDPRFADAYIAEGDAYMGSGKSREAFAAYEKAVSVAPSNPDAHYSLGAAYNSMAQYGDSFKHFVQAIRLDPGFAEAHYGIGYAYLKLDNFRDALVYLRQAVRLRPDYADAHLALGEDYLGLRDFKSAEAELKALAAIDPSLAGDLEKEIRAAGAVVKTPPPQNPTRPAAEAQAQPPRPKPRPQEAVAAPTPQRTAAPQRPAEAPATAPATNSASMLAVELSFWDSVKNSSDPEEFAAYLRKYPEGQFAELARIRLRALEGRKGDAPNVARAEAEPKPPTPVSTAQATPEQPSKFLAEQPAEAAAKQSLNVPTETREQPTAYEGDGTKRPSNVAAGTPPKVVTEPPTQSPSTQPTPAPAGRPVKSATEKQTNLVAEQTPAVVAARPAQVPTAKETGQPAEEKRQPTEEKKQAAEEVKEAAAEKKQPAGEPGEPEGATTIEAATGLLQRLFPSRFSYKATTRGGAGAPPVISEVGVNFGQLQFDGCSAEWRDQSDTLSVSLSDLDPEGVTVAPRAKAGTSFSIEVWNVGIAATGGQGVITETKGDGSGAVNHYNGLDLQYDGKEKADGVARALRQAIRLCGGKP